MQLLASFIYLFFLLLKYFATFSKKFINFGFKLALVLASNFNSVFTLLVALLELLARFSNILPLLINILRRFGCS